MPHCIIEYSSNVPDDVDFHAFFRDLHALMVGTGQVQLDQIKSRWIRHDNFLVGDGSPQHGFVYLHIAMLNGRSESVRKNIADSALELLQRFFPRAQRDLVCSITVEVREIERSTHAKLFKSGPLLNSTFASEAV